MARKTGKRYPSNVYPFLDYDYLERLPQSARDFLTKFNEEFYGATFSAHPLHTDDAQRREIGRVKSRRNQDIYNHPETRRRGEAGTAAGTAPPPEADPASTPEYRMAVAAFRALLPEDGRRNVELTPEFAAVRAALFEMAGVETDMNVTKGDKIQKLKVTRQIVTNLGAVVSAVQFKGSDAQAAVEMLQWLGSFRARVDERLEKLGVTPEAPAVEAAPAEAEASNG